MATKKLLLSDKSLQDIRIHELDERPDGDAIQSALYQQTGQRTVPNVFINGQHLGGNDATQAAYRSGKLHEMLKKQ
jgi:glutaredoxin 3